MRSFFGFVLVLVCFAFHPAYGATVWTDVDDDGLPDTLPITVPLSTIFRVDVWLDGQDLIYDGYRVWIVWDENFEYLSGSAENNWAPCVLDPPKLNENRIGFAARNCAPLQGVRRIGRFDLRLIHGPGGCVRPLVLGGFTEFVSFLSANGAIQPFRQGNGSCFLGSVLLSPRSRNPSFAESVTWGKLKTLF